MKKGRSSHLVSTNLTTLSLLFYLEKCRMGPLAGAHKISFNKHASTLKGKRPRYSVHEILEVPEIFQLMEKLEGKV